MVSSHFTLGDIVSAVVPAVREALKPDFNALEERLSNKIDLGFDSVNSDISELAIMIKKEFDNVNSEFRGEFKIVNDKLDDLSGHLNVLSNRVEILECKPLARSIR